MRGRDALRHQRRGGMPDTVWLCAVKAAIGDAVVVGAAAQPELPDERHKAGLARRRMQQFGELFQHELVSAMCSTPSHTSS